MLLGDGLINLIDVVEFVESVLVCKLLNMVFLFVIKDYVSDIYFELFEDEFRICIKFDGILYEMVFFL